MRGSAERLPSLRTAFPGAGRSPRWLADAPSRPTPSELAAASIHGRRFRTATPIRGMVARMRLMTTKRGVVAVAQGSVDTQRTRRTSHSMQSVYSRELQRAICARIRRGPVHATMRSCVNPRRLVARGHRVANQHPGADASLPLTLPHRCDLAEIVLLLQVRLRIDATVSAFSGNRCTARLESLRMRRFSRSPRAAAVACDQRGGSCQCVGAIMSRGPIYFDAVHWIARRSARVDLAGAFSTARAFAKRAQGRDHALRPGCISLSLRRSVTGRNN